MIKPDKKTLAAHLKQLRENKRLSQESLGKIATDNEGFNVPNVRRTVSDWENPDKGFPSADKIARICVFFQITPTE
ncbi:helix-turn-helix transcriptional regulator, partial [Oenococcus oeni]